MLTLAFEKDSLVVKVGGEPVDAGDYDLWFYTGEVTADDVLDRLFSSFCLGK